MGRLRQIQEEMLELLEEAKSIVTSKKPSHRQVYDRMKAYWHPHIKMALTNDHEYVGKECSMEEAISEIDGNGDTLEDLVEYAGDVDVNKLRDLIDPSLPEDSTLEQIIENGLTDLEPEDIRDYIDSVT